MITLPTRPETANIQSLAAWKSERLTGQTTTTLAFTNVIDREGVLLFKNGSLVDPEDYTIVAHTIVLDSAATDTDVFVLHYHYTRPAGG